MDIVNGASRRMILRMKWLRTEMLDKQLRSLSYDASACNRPAAAWLNLLCAEFSAIKTVYSA